MELDVDTSANIKIALLLTTLAGSATMIGAAIAYFIKEPRLSYLTFSLGFSAGTMIYVSFMELLTSAIQTLGQLKAVVVFFIGMFFIGIIDFLIPESENPDHFNNLQNPHKKTLQDKKLLRASMMTALAIGIHNFPEGLATFGAALSDIRLGVLIAIAIAIHNIPEGISVSMPIFYATGNRNKVFFFSAISGLSEPLGALVGYAFLRHFLSPGLLAGLLAFVAGIMIYVSVDELLPMVHRYGHSHTVIIGIILGMMVMAASLVML
ncbi:Zinc transporter ZupT [Candidatus Brocadiaceae bacterium S225]|nr:Zinc transporter ZupT [Candidatus Brocadiaceae bacterium S225]